MRIRTLAGLFSASVAVVGGAAVPAFAAGTGNGTVVGAGAPGAIPGRYIVTLADENGATGAFGAAGVAVTEGGQAPVASVATALGDGTSRGGRVSLMSAGGRTTSYAARMSVGQARRLAGDPRVRVVEQDRVVKMAADTQRNPVWGLDRIDQRGVTGSKTYTAMDDGSGVHAYVLDTGIRISHREFGGRASYGVDVIDGDSVAADCNGHGTHVAGTIGGAHYGVAKKVRLVAVRVLDCAGEGTLSGVIRGVNWVTSHAVKPAVANMSMGGDYSAALDNAVQKSIRSGVTYVVAAGNEDVNARKVSPAALPAAITVGATGKRDRRASFSNYGSVLDLFAPGVDITSAWASSDTALAVASGTSMASPHVAGAAALVLDATPAMTPAQVQSFLVGKATSGKVADLAGSPNRLLFVPAPAAAPVIRSTGITVRPGRAYSTRLTLTAARRGSWSLSGGTLPKGLKLTADGAVSGTPTAPGTATVTVKFVDYVPNSVTKVLTVGALETAPVITTTALPAALIGSAYGNRLSVAAGRAGTWALYSGELPAGLTLAANGRLTGVGEQAGSTTFEVRFTDIWGKTATAGLTITVQ